jgi:hypothetical protein
MQKEKMTRFYGVICDGIYCDIESKIMGFERSAVLTMSTKYDLTELSESDRNKLTEIKKKEEVWKFLKSRT